MMKAEPRALDPEKEDDDEDIRWVAADEENGRELGPVFESEVTAAEIAKLYNEGARFCNRIPNVPYGSAIPRPVDVDTKTRRPDEPTPRAGVHGRKAPPGRNHAPFVVEPTDDAKD